jgi:hypothetical protein
MLYHNKCISANNVSYGTTTSTFHRGKCHAVPRPVQPSNMSYCTTTSVFHLVVCHTVPQPVYFTWQCVVRYHHNQCISLGKVLCGATTSAFHHKMCHAVLQPVYFSWQCAMRYQNQCISPGNVLCAPQPVYCSWQCIMRYHNQCISLDIMSYCTTTSVFHLAMCYAVPQPMYFTW